MKKPEENGGDALHQDYTNATQVTYKLELQHKIIIMTSVRIIVTMQVAVWHRHLIIFHSVLIKWFQLIRSQKQIW